jgi:hypothetical protein
LYKISRSFDGFFAIAIRNSVDELITGGRNAIQLITELGEQVGSVARLFFEGGFAAIRSADNLAKGISNLPVCPLSLTTLSTQAGCDPKEIQRIVNTAVKNARDAKISQQDFLQSMLNVCCDVADGGKGYIPGSEFLLNRVSQSGKLDAVREAYSVSRAADSFRGAGFINLEIPQSGIYTVFNSSGILVNSEPDIIGEINGTLRVIEVKSASGVDQDQQTILINLAQAIGGERGVTAIPSYIRMRGKVSGGLAQNLRSQGIDVLNLEGQVINP